MPASNVTHVQSPISFLEDADVVLDLAFVFLSNTLSNPDYVPVLLLLELHKGVEHSEVELLLKRQLQHAHL